MGQECKGGGRLVHLMCGLGPLCWALCPALSYNLHKARYRSPEVEPYIPDTIVHCAQAEIPGLPRGCVEASTWEASHSLEESIRGCPSSCRNCGGHGWKWRKKSPSKQQSPCLPSTHFCLLTPPEVLALYLTGT